jgi:hypothetical protein
MNLAQIVYYIALTLFIVMTFLIIRNYYRSKFDDEGRRMDMLDEEKRDPKDLS